MIGLLIADLDKEMTEAETQEKDSQADYEELMKDSAEKRAADSKSLADKEAAKANLQGDLEQLKDTLKEGGLQRQHRRAKIYASLSQNLLEAVIEDYAPRTVPPRLQDHDSTTSTLVFLRIHCGAQCHLATTRNEHGHAVGRPVRGVARQDL